MVEVYIVCNISYYYYKCNLEDGQRIFRFYYEYIPLMFKGNHYLCLITLLNLKGMTIMFTTYKIKIIRITTDLRQG